VEPFKIQIFEREHGPGTFIWFRNVSKPEALELLHRLKKRLQLPAQADALNVLKIMRDRSTRLEGLNADDKGFDLRLVLGRLRATDRVFLNWHHFDDLNEVRVEDLRNYFEYLWYPSSDDLEILDPELGWILSIDHSGNILLLDLS
jgi:hypothetical protein